MVNTKRCKLKGPVDLADVEHVATLAVGGLMFLAGTTRRGPMSNLMKMGGLALLVRGQKGYRHLYERIGLPMPAQPSGIGRFNRRAEASVIVARPKEELFRIWRTFSNLPIFMDHLVSVEEHDSKHSLWTAKGPAGTVIRWEAEIINEIENERIAWQSLEGSGVDHAGTVVFEDVEGGTRIHVVLRYDPPGDQIGAWLAKAVREDPQTQMERDLHRFKQIMEIGGRDYAPALT